MSDTTSMFGEGGIGFVVRSGQTGIFSAAWNIRAHRTSFYLTPLGVGTVPLKLSLHGKDERPGISDPGFKLGIVEESYSKAVAEGSRVLDVSQYLPRWFSGREVEPGVRHALRFMHRPGLFAQATPSASIPQPTKSSTIHSCFSAPEEADEVVYIDVYVSQGKPYWEDVEATRAADAGVGPIVNTNREYITVIGRKVDYKETLDPFSDLYEPLENHDPEADGPVRRVQTFRHDAHEVMWITEVLMPDRVLEGEANAYKPPSKRRT